MSTSLLIAVFSFVVFIILLTGFKRTNIRFLISIIFSLVVTALICLLYKTNQDAYSQLFINFSNKFLYLKKYGISEENLLIFGKNLIFFIVFIVLFLISFILSNLFLNKEDYLKQEDANYRFIKGVCLFFNLIFSIFVISYFFTFMSLATGIDDGFLGGYISLIERIILSL